MSSPTPCAEPTRLRQLLEEALAAPEEAELSAHLQGCAACRQRLEELAGGTDSWAEASDLLTQGPPGSGSEPALERVLARLEGCLDGDEVRGPGGATVDVGFLEAPARAGHTGSVEALAFAPDGATLASGSRDRTVRLWDAATGQPGPVLRGHAGEVLGVAFAQGGKALVSCGGSGDAGEIRLWNVAAGKPAGTLPAPGGQVMDVACSPDGQRLAAGGFDRLLHVYDLEARKELPALDGDKKSGYLRRVGFTNDGRRVFSAGDLLNFYDARTGAPGLSIPHPATTDVRLSPRGDVLAAAGFTTGRITLFDAATGKPLEAWQADREALHALAYSPDGRFLASTGGDGTVKVWDAATQKLRAVLLGHRSDAYGVAFSPDGRTLATGGVLDHNVLLWDVSALQAGPAP